MTQKHLEQQKQQKQQIKGIFDIVSTPHPALELGDGVQAGRMTFNKQYKGELEGRGLTEMMGYMSMALKSGGYVALERIVGKLMGKEGSFLLQHSSTMTRGEPSQSVSVIPDSGTGGLVGLTGSMRIDVIDRVHHYTFDFYLPSL